MDTSRARFAISSVQEPEPSLLAPAWPGQDQGQASRKLKGILKKNEDSSHTIHGHPAAAASPFTSPYQTVSGAGWVEMIYTQFSPHPTYILMHLHLNVQELAEHCAERAADL